MFNHQNYYKMSVNTSVLPELVALISMLFTLAIIMVVTPFRASRQPDVKKPPASLTFRISNIPRNLHKADFEEEMTQNKFEAILNSIQNDLSKKTDPSAHPPAQVLYSFAPSAHSATTFVATATIYDHPAPSQLESAIKDKIGSDSAQLRVDHDFFGLTPLTAPEEPEVE